MIKFFFEGYFFQVIETYACPVLDIIIIIGIFKLAYLLDRLIKKL